MHGEKCRAERRQALNAARHGVADVVQFEIDEHLLAGGREWTYQRQSACISELIADLVEGDAVAQTRDHRLRLIQAGQIERHNQPVFRSDGRHWHVTSHQALGDVDQLPHHRSHRLDVGRMFQTVPIVIGLVGEGKRELVRNHKRVAGRQDQPQRRQRP